MSSRPPQQRSPIPWFIAAGVLLILAVLSGIGGVSSGIGSLFDEQFRLEGFGENRITVEVPGVYWIYHETTGHADGVFEHEPELPSGLSCEVMDPAGNQVELDDSKGSTSYRVGSRRGQSIATFLAVEAGDYTLTVHVDDESVPARLLVKRWDADDLFGPMLFGIAGGALLGIASLVALIIGIVRAARRPAAASPRRAG